MRPADPGDARFELPGVERPHAGPSTGAMSDLDEPTRSLRVSAGATKPCPLCGAPGEATSLFKGVYMCMAEPCSVWTFEDPDEVGSPDS